MKIEIELIKEASELMIWPGWKVTYGDKYAHGLSSEEMFGLVAAITIPEDKRYLSWLRTKEQWEEHIDKFT